VRALFLGAGRAATRHGNESAHLAVACGAAGKRGLMTPKNGALHKKRQRFRSVKTGVFGKNEKIAKKEVDGVGAYGTLAAT